MHEYDISLKSLLRGSGSGALREVIGGVGIEMQNTRVDLPRLFGKFPRQVLLYVGLLRSPCQAG